MVLAAGAWPSETAQRLECKSRSQAGEGELHETCQLCHRILLAQKQDRSALLNEAQPFWVLEG